MNQDVWTDPAGLSPPRLEMDGFFSICFERPRSEPINEPINEPITEPITEPIKVILAQLMRYPNAKLKVLESATGCSKAKLKRYITIMKKDDLLCYLGSLKNGHYEITVKDRTVLNGKTKKTE